VKSILLYKKCY